MYHFPQTVAIFKSHQSLAVFPLPFQILCSMLPAQPLHLSDLLARRL